MSMIEFTANHTDHSNDQGFQFEFHCDKCGNGHMTPFAPSKIGMAGGFLRAAAGLFGGGALDRIASAGDQVKDSLRGKARDDAFAAAVQEGKKHFKKCTRCGKWVCPETCWNAERPDVSNLRPGPAGRAGRRPGHGCAAEQVWEKARAADLTADVDVKKKQAAFCPHCGAKAGGGKFCGECGKEIMPKDACPQCQAKIKPGSKFCGECGAKI